MARNSFVEQSVDLFVAKVDQYISGKQLDAPPNQKFRSFFRSLIDEQGGSVGSLVAATAGIST
jgi:hypothetical protein